MENPNEEDKARALCSQLNLCRRMAEEVGDPDLAEKLRNLAEKLKATAPVQTAAFGRV
jgi:hypothetical protein